MAILEVEGNVIDAEEGKIPATTIYKVKFEGGEAQFDLPDSLVKLNKGERTVLVLASEKKEDIIEKSDFCAKARLVEKSGSQRVVVSISGFIGVFTHQEISEFFEGDNTLYFCIIRK